MGNIAPKTNQLTLSSEDYRWLAYGTSGEAVPDTDDVYGVAASILYRVASPMFPNTVKGVVLQRNASTGKHEYQHIDHNKAVHMPDRAAYFATEEGQYKLIKAGLTLKGRTNFKGQSELSNRKSTDGVMDPMFHAKGNFFHHWWQEKGMRKPKNWTPPSLDQFIDPAIVKARDALLNKNGGLSVYFK